jgi:hypothetical protein
MDGQANVTIYLSQGKQKGVDRRTDDATWFVYDNKLAFFVMENNFDWSRCHRWFMAMGDISFEQE